MTPEETEIVKRLLPINGHDECFMCGFGSKPDNKFMHFDADNVWGGDRECLWHPRYDAIRRVLGVVGTSNKARADKPHGIDIKDLHINLAGELRKRRKEIK